MKTAAPVERGFTLIELLVVMGIIGLLVMLLMPVVNYAFVVAQGVATGNTFKLIETGLIGFRGDFGVYPPSDNLHETMTEVTAYGYKNLAIGLGGPDGVGWGWDGTAADTDKRMPFGGTSDVKFGPYFEGVDGLRILDSYKPGMPILYFRYEQSGDPEATDPTKAVYDFNDNKATDLTKGEDGFVNQGNLMMLLRRRETYQYVRRDYVLISAGPDRVFGYRVGPDANGVYTFVNPSPAIQPPATAYTGAYCDDLANFKYEQY
jgi:prepilin-type N-terminal cleavage/methylation domain-containing protein